MLIYLYRFLTLLGVPLVWLFLQLRKLRGKEHPERIHERFGKPSFSRPDGALIWMHAASVGEAHSLMPLVKKMLDTYPQSSVLITTGTVTSAQLIDTKLPERAYHQFVPVDTWPAMARFLDHWQPDVAILAESELWPNLITLTHEIGTPMALLNARMSLKSFHLWSRFRGTIRRLIRCFDLVCPGSPDDKEHFVQLGARNVHMLGNLKHDSPPLPADSKAMGALVAQIADRPVWVAASTHRGEEELISKAHEQLVLDHPSLLTIIAPRHPERGERIAARLRESGLNVSLRSEGEDISESTDIYIANTIGELGIFYRIASIVFMGGSLVEHGGQNPMEAARLDCALITGPHTDNFTAICAELEARKALIRVTDADQLVSVITELLRDHAKQEAYAQTALKFATDKQGVLEQIMDELAPLLEKGLADYPPPPRKQPDEAEAEKEEV